MFHVSNESLFIKLLTTSKMFLPWLNIKLELLKIGCNQTKYVNRGTCPEWLPPPDKSSASQGNNKGGWEALGDQMHGMVSCKPHKCCTVRGR